MAAALEGPSTVVAVMQPYFAAYAGYYRLLAAADVFVIFDCVQFPRRGWVHRNRLADANGEPAWLTLPLKPAPYEAPISAMEFADDAPARMAERLRAFPSLQSLPEQAARLLHAAPFHGPLVDYLEAQIEVACVFIGVRPRLIRSSTLQIPPELKAQDRVLAILGALDTSDYINAPGGRDLYDEAAFAARGIRLEFLEPYAGPSWSLLQRIAQDAEACRAEILAQTPVVRQPCNPRPAA